MYIADPAQKRWLQQRLESIRSTPNFLQEKKRHILNRLTAAEGLERYCTPSMSARSAFRSRAGKLHRRDGRVDPARRRIGC